MNTVRKQLFIQYSVFLYGKFVFLPLHKKALTKGFLLDRKMNQTDEENIKPQTRKVLVIEWPDQRSVFEKNKGKVLILKCSLTGSVSEPISTSRI